MEGENLAAAGARGVPRRRAGAALPPLRVTIEKRIPVAAGLGGGSADAAAVLRAANAMAGAPLDPRRACGPWPATLGSDVPSQVSPAHALVSGVGEVVEPVGLPPMALVLVPQERGLSTADVYAELDRLRARRGPPRERPRPGRAAATGRGLDRRRWPTGTENDLEPPPCRCAPSSRGSLEALRASGALARPITGSGPTAFGVFARPRGGRGGGVGAPSRARWSAGAA